MKYLTSLHNFGLIKNRSSKSICLKIHIIKKRRINKNQNETNKQLRQMKCKYLLITKNEFSNIYKQIYLNCNIGVNI